MLGLVSSPRLLRTLALAQRLRVALRRRRAAARRADAERTRFYEAAWRDAAEQLGGRVERLGDGILEIAAGGSVTRVCRNYTALDDPVTLMLAGDKTAVYRLLAEDDIPIPRHLEFTFGSVRRAAEFLERSDGPCVIKPAKDTGAGNGVTTGITRHTHLTAACVAAGAFGGRMLIEEQVAGDNYRLLFLDGELVDAVRRRPPSVVGDGRASIRALIRRANADRLARGYAAAQVQLTRDADMRRTLARQGLSLRSVPAVGERVVVKTVINDNAAWENEPAADLLCDAVVECGARAARAVGVRLAGIDVVTPDPSRPLRETGGVILEVNTTPGFYYHYHNRGRRCDVAAHVLETLLRSPAATAAGV